MHRLLLPLLAIASLAAGETRDRLLMVVERGFNVQEAWAPWTALTAAGWRIDIASKAPGPVFADLDGKPGERDLAATLSYDGIDLDAYAGVIIPGGYSPGFLQRDPVAVRLVQTAVGRRQPIGLICHGPRMLLAADQARDRVITCLHTVPDELADLWRDGAYGTWIDAPVVVDGTVVTSRSPIDVDAFAGALMDLHASRGGLARPAANARVLVITKGATRHARYLWTCLQPLAIAGTVVETTDLAAHLISPKLQRPDLVVALGLDEGQAATVAGLGLPILAAADLAAQLPASRPLPDDLPGRLRAVVAAAVALHLPRPAPALAIPALTIRIEPGFDARLLAAAVVCAPGSPVRIAAATPGAVRGLYGAAIAEAETGGPSGPTLSLRGVGREVAGCTPAFDDALAAAVAAPGPAPAAPTDLIALAPGFDAMAVAAIRARLAGRAVLLVGPTAGPVTGLNGATLAAHRAYVDIAPAAGQRVWAPGGLWPRKNAQARQAEQPAWLVDQDRLDRQRLDWCHAALAAGADLVSVGFDGLVLGGDARAAGLTVAASTQALWSFPTNTGKFKNLPVVTTTPHWNSVRSWQDLALLP
jgi:protease I